MRKIIAGGLVSLLMTTSAFAAVNIASTGTIADSSGTASYGNSSPASAIIDGIKGDSTIGTTNSYWVANDFQFSGTETGYVTIDLGATYNITGFTLTDTHNGQYYDRGTKDFTIGVGSSAALALANAKSNSAAVTSTFSLAQWEGLTDLTAGAAATGEFVTFYALTDWSNNPDSATPATGDGMANWPTRSAGLSELQAFGTLASIDAPVPEPISMALLGTGLLGLLAMRRRSV